MQTGTTQQHSKKEWYSIDMWSLSYLYSSLDRGLLPELENFHVEGLQARAKILLLSFVDDSFSAIRGLAFIFVGLGSIRRDLDLAVENILNLLHLS